MQGGNHNLKMSEKLLEPHLAWALSLHIQGVIAIEILQSTPKLIITTQEMQQFDHLMQHTYAATNKRIFFRCPAGSSADCPSSTIKYSGTSTT